MKKAYKILTLAFAIAALCSCSDKSLSDDETIISVPVNDGSYIQFDTDVESRGALVEQLEGSFGVHGYQYSSSSNWNTVKVLTKPNVFDGKGVSNDKDSEGKEIVTTAPKGVAALQEVEYINGIFSYSPIKKWSGNKYSFFAFYPYSTVNPKASTVDEAGEPYITYTLPSRTDPAVLADVMTGSVIDTDVNRSKSVALHMYHRLSALDIAARNYYEYDPNDKVEGDEELITIQLQSLKVTFSNLVNESAKLYLNRDRKITTTDADNNSVEVVENAVYTKAGDITAAYKIPCDGFSVVPNTDMDTKMRYITTSEQKSTMIVIPQEEHLEVTLDFTYYKVRPNGNGYLKDTTKDNTTVVEESTTPVLLQATKSVTIAQPLKEGRRYYIQLTFTSEAISINIITADEWNDKDVDYEFE